MKKNISIILLIVLLGFLFLYIPVWYNNTPKNDFKRKLIEPNINIKGQMDFDQNNPFLACVTEEGIWIQNRQELFTIFSVDDHLRQQKKIKIFPPSNFNINRRNYYYTKIDSTIFITNEGGEIARSGKGKNKFFKIPNHKFDIPVAKSENTLFVRSFILNSNRSHLEISKIAITDSARIVKTYVLPKQLDGIFSADGRLKYDRENDKLFYVYYFRGEIVCLDTNLNLVYNAKTIDTIKVAKLKIVKTTDKSKSGGEVLKASILNPIPPLNKFFIVNNSKIYIYSTLKADNQSKANFLNNNSIDVYSAKDGRYIHSFEIPKYKGNRLGEFSLKGNNFLAIYPGKIVRFTFGNL